jgi:hypothetical protein
MAAAEVAEPHSTKNTGSGCREFTHAIFQVSFVPAIDAAHYGVLIFV